MLTLNINDKDYAVDAAGDMPLLWVLRDLLGLTGTKFGCGSGLCGACTVHLNGVAARSCQTAVSKAADKKILTIEGMASTDVGRRVQRAWLDMDVVQCGYCQPGQIMQAASLLTKIKSPSDAEIDSAMSGNICRCGTYPRIRAAIQQAAKSL
ncbi:MAG TPA: (2Fe-2S)-binding protein, partial [Candidatus Manganitrophaceae bacterium]|nr:(2Fe-2S)-binding protein [Candidatus Manganitrophaceae bacterium]